MGVSSRFQPHRLGRCSIMLPLTHIDTTPGDFAPLPMSLRHPHLPSPLPLSLRSSLSIPPLFPAFHARPFFLNLIPATPVRRYASPPCVVVLLSMSPLLPPMRLLVFSFATFPLSPCVTLLPVSHLPLSSSAFPFYLCLSHFAADRSDDICLSPLISSWLSFPFSSAFCPLSPSF